MYNLFNEYISKYDNDDLELEQYWYSYDYIECEEMLKKFNNEDWEMLINSLPSRSNIFKKRLVCCFSVSDNIYQIEIISQFINTDDFDLFMKTLYTISNYGFILSKKVKEDILKKMDYFTPKASLFDKEVFKSIKEDIVGSQFNSQMDKQK